MVKQWWLATRRVYREWRLWVANPARRSFVVHFTVELGTWGKSSTYDAAGNVTSTIPSRVSSSFGFSLREDGLPAPQYDTPVNEWGQ